MSPQVPMPASIQNCTPVVGGGLILAARAPQNLTITHHTSSAAYRTNPVQTFGFGTEDKDFKAFQQVMIPAFCQLDWDLYDVRRAQIQAIETANPELSPAQQQLLKDYFTGDVDQAQLSVLFQTIPSAVRESVETLGPWRKKACTQLKATQLVDSREWFIEQQADDTFAQRVAKNDYRSAGRKYKPIPSHIFDQPKLQEILGNLLYLVKQASPNASTIHITTWMMSCYTWPNVATTNTPEGVHQDGADYVLSAFVLERNNIVGGKSRIFAPDAAEPFMETVLNSGEGIFHADAESALRHDVSHISVDDCDKVVGVRSLLGFDIYVQ